MVILALAIFVALVYLLALSMCAMARDEPRKDEWL